MKILPNILALSVSTERMYNQFPLEIKGIIQVLGECKCFAITLSIKRMKVKIVVTVLSNFLLLKNYFREKLVQMI